MTLPAHRNCGYCGTSLAFEGGVGAYGRIFCNDICADDYERELEAGAWTEYDAAVDAVNDEYGVY